MNRYNELNATLDNIISDANSQLTGLHNKVASRSLPCGMCVLQQD